MSKENAPAIAQPQTEQLSPSQRFTKAVVKEFESSNGQIELTEFQNRLIQNYFVKLDSVLKEAERKRLLKKETNRDAVSLTWDNINIPDLAEKTVVFTRVGLDPNLPNHLNLIPYKNNSTGKYDIGFIQGYRGLEIKAKKYGLDKVEDVVVEVVYENDIFKPIKKGQGISVETYIFEIKEPFNRGKVVGGFYYQVFEDERKNKLRTFSLADIEKRKPAYASPEFWGGEKDVWENGQKKGKEVVEGWFDEMVYKTIYRAAYNDITLDAQKIDDVISFVLKIENEERLLPSSSEQSKEEVKREISQEANTETISFTDVTEKVQAPEKAVKEDIAKEKKEPEIKKGF